MDFIVLDFETANPSMASICQVGIAEFQNGELSDRYASLINPEDYFSDLNVAIHGIDEQAISDAPTFPDVYPNLADRIKDRVVVSHTPFDRNALRQSLARYGLPGISCRWLDSARVVRRTWPQCATSGYGLLPVAERLNIQFQHHDAFEDARAAGLILIQAIKESGLGIEEWLTKSLEPLGSKAFSGFGGSIVQDGNPAGVLYGECIVFTGALQIVRREAARLAAKIGCSVADSVTKKTSILVVGDQDIRRLRPGESRSSKQRKAESLIEAGVPIRIMGESDFMELCKIEA